MKRVIALLVLVLTISACSDDSERFVPVEQQNVLPRMTGEASYGVAGVPYYKDGRWMSNVRIDGCKTNITIGAQKAPEPQHPYSFTVLAVGGKPLSELSPGVNGLFLLAEELEALPGMAERLGCTV